MTILLELKVSRISNLQKVSSCTSKLSSLKRFSRHTFLVLRLGTWDWKMLRTGWDRCSMTIRNLSWTCVNSIINTVTIEVIWYSMVFMHRQRLMSMDLAFYADDASFIAPWGSTMTLPRWRRLDSGVASAWWCHSGAEWNSVMWKADGCFHFSVFGRCQAHEFLEWPLIDFEIGRRCSSSCLSQVFVKPHVISRCIMIAAVFAVTPQDLGVLESCRPTAAMAPPHRWLSQKMLKVEDFFRKFLGSNRSGWPDAGCPKTTVVYVECKCNTSTGWLICCGVWNVWLQHCRNTLNNQLLKLLIGKCLRPAT